MAMVALKCPGCGSDIELDNSREFGFCSYCGTKVMQEKVVVEHRGSVTVDNSEFVAKYLQNARRAKQKEDWEETEKYYNLVEQNDPSNIEAIFYSAYGKAKQALKDRGRFLVLRFTTGFEYVLISLKRFGINRRLFLR